MYNIPYFKEPDKQKVLQFMQAHPFAMLIGCADGMPVATQVPLLIEDRNGVTFLKGHIMRHTSHHKALKKNANALCVFSGAHAYISASWYTNPQVASTWNYMSVHAKGTLTFLSAEALLQMLQQTTAHFENNAHSLARFENLPEAHVERLAKAIVGFQIEVKELDNVFKLSQNRERESYDNIISSLQHGDANAQTIAAEMLLRKPQLFHTD